jgi:hypothetical protein
MDELIQKKHLTRKGMILAFAIAAVFVFGLIALAVLVVQKVERNSDIADFHEKTPRSGAYVIMVVRVSSVDLNKEELSMSGEVLRGGDLATRQKNRQVELTASAQGLKVSATLDPGKQGDALDLSDSMKGNVSDYPWDSHESTIVMTAKMTEDSGRTVDVPIRMSYYGALQGLDVNVTVDSTGGGSVKEINTTILRSTVTTIMVCFSILLIWVLIVTVVVMVMYVVVLKHELQMMMFAFFGTLLFAMTAFRNAMPGTPPMGVLSDYIAFFWGYLTAIVGIGILTVIWVDRLPHEDRHKKGHEEPPAGPPPDAAAGPPRS